VSLLKVLPHEEIEAGVTHIGRTGEWDIIALVQGITVVLQTCKDKDEALRVLRGYITGGA
jgi:hypothetical protein